MNSIYVDTDILEQISDIYHFASNALEETEATLRSTYNEMCAEPCKFYGLSQWDDAVNNTQMALKHVAGIRERVIVLERLLMSVKDGYADLERQHIETLQQVSAQISTINTLIQGVMSKDYPMGITEGEEGSKARQLEQSLMNTIVGMEIANLAAVRKATDEEFAIESVSPIGTSTMIVTERENAEDEE